jgi:inner membrane protein
MQHGAWVWPILIGFGLATPEQGVDFWLPMGFLIGGALLFLWELSMPGFFVAVPATILVVLGLIGLAVPGLFTESALGPLWAIVLAIVVAAPTTMVTLRVYRSFAPPDAPPTTTSAESMRGRQGTVIVVVDPETTRGKVRIDGVVWSARSESGGIPPEIRVEVVEVRGVHVLVRPAAKPLGATPAAEPRKTGDAMA